MKRMHQRKRHTQSGGLLYLYLRSVLFF